MSVTPVSPAAVSPLDAAQQALGHTRRHLFPFRFERWLALGFVAFLDQCGRTQAGAGFSGPRLPIGAPGGGGEGGRPPVLSDVYAWFAAHAMLLLAIAAVALVLILCLIALVLWINSRGVFMYVDNVATGRADVSRPWREHSRKADSYFAWSLGLAVTVLAGGILLLAAAAVVVLRMAQGGAGLAGAVAVLVILAALFLAFVIAAALASLALRDFVAPIQMRADVTCGAAIGLFLGLLGAYPWAFVLYVFLKIAFALALAFVLMIAACVTCCCALIPVVTQTLLQPAFYFERAWSLCLLRQLGYDLVGAPPSSGVPFVTREEPPHAPEPG